MGYTLVVYYPGRTEPEHVELVEAGDEALERARALIAGRPECEKVVVMYGLTRLFSVDCKGERLPD